MRKFLITLLLLTGLTTAISAQRVSYPQLVSRTQMPTIFIDELIVPNKDSSATLAFVFRFNNDFIPFKKLPLNHTFDAPEDAEFYATMRLSTDIFEGKLKRRKEPSANSISRDFWTDTLFTKTFDETQSDELFASGILTNKLKPGHYNFLLQLTMMQELIERKTQRQEVTIPDFEKKKTGEVYLLRNAKSGNNARVLELMNMEKNVPYGEDFSVLIRIPDYETSAGYTVEVHKARTSKDDTTAVSKIYSSNIESDAILEDQVIEIINNEEPAIRLNKVEEGFTYARINLPASTFENSAYLLKVMKDDQNKPVAEGFFKSYWPDMPASLYNLNIAIDMLKFIIPDKEVDRIKKGNSKEKEQKFREFWEQRDPTPNTVYNELMAEYYRRIDYAFMEFGSQENPMGHESDQGEVYIKFGPPDNKVRRFPESGKTIEVWEYPNRTFIFEASTGFGDFKLIGTR